VSFGLVSIPIKLYSAANSSSGVHFNMMHNKCGTRLKQQLWCPKDEETVPRTDTVKGYEFAKGQYVLFTDEEYKALLERATQTIEIVEFVPLDKIDPVFFDKPYLLGPDKGGDRAYKLLSKALEKSGRAALAKYAARGKQYLVMLRPKEGGLLLQQLHYADELRSMADVPVGDAEVKDSELDLAMQIIEQAVSDKFEPEKYTDDVRARMLNAIEEKVAGQEITAAPEEPVAEVIDLMEALKSSLAKGGGKRPARRAPRTAKGKTVKAVKKTATKKKRARA
jgi:DNA end-binding protein Ku